MSARGPLVSIGLPVFNGAAYLEEAIRSVLAQCLDDLELVISDNASTDRTAEICRGWAATDRRVRYLRNPTNLGAAPNYNRTFAESRGRYFKWLAHDDRLRSEYLATTVAVLEADPSVVLCNTTVDYIDGRGVLIGQYRSPLGLAAAERPSERFAALVLQSHSCVDFFGTIRRSALEGSLLHGPFHGADRALLAQLALRGRMVQLEPALVEMREHPQRYTRRQRSGAARQAWHEATATRRPIPSLELYRPYRRLVATEPLTDAERRACRRVLARWWLSNWNALRVAADLVDSVAPGFVGWAERVKIHFFGAAPGHFLDDVEGPPRPPARGSVRS
jgi:glycosyltransferase involved in cell wall biosynthesis